MIQSIRQFVSGLFTKAPEFKDSSYVFVKDDFDLFTLGGGWGDRIAFWPDFDRNSKKQSVYGNKQDRPEKGDLLEAQHVGGRISIWAFTSVRYESDPPDLFFASVVSLGWKDEMEIFEGKES